MICAWLLAVEPGLLPSALTERAPGPATVARGWLRRWRQGPGHLPRYARLWREACLEPGLASRCLPHLHYRVVPPPRLLSGSNPEGGSLTSWLGRGSLEGHADCWLSALSACNLGKVTLSELVSSLYNGILVAGWVCDTGF